MANTVIALKKSATPTAAPTNLANGELAINYADGKLFYKHANGTIAAIEGGGTGGNSFGTINANGTLIVADTPGDILTIEAGTNVTITADAINDKITISASGGISDLSPALIQANTARDHANAAFASANAGQATANAAFDKANSANITADRAFNHANAAFITANIAFANANTVMISAQAAFTVANAAFLHANSGYAFANSIAVTANLAFAHANAAFANGNVVIQTAQSAFTQANAAIASASAGQATANAAFVRANLAHAHANAAFASSNSVNTYSNSTYVKLSATSQTITGNVNIVGDLTLSGNTFVIDATRLEVDDPLIYLAANNYTSDIVDIGFIANYVNATGQNVHTGLYREHEDKMYYLFQGYDREPINNHLGALSNNMTLAVLNADLRTSNLVLGGANAILTIGAAFDKANSTTYTSNVVISVADNTNAALRITQTGTGDAIRVEDSANPDATPFVIDASGQVGFGTATPFPLTSTFISTRDPLVASDGSYIGGGAYYDGAAWRSTVASQGGWVIRNTTGMFSLWTGYNSGAANTVPPVFSERLRVDGNGRVGIGTTTPNTKLMVYGTTGSTADFRITGQNINSFMSSFAFGDTDVVPVMELLKINGTDTARSNVRVGASLGRISWFGARGNTGDALTYRTGDIEVITTSEASGGATPGGAMLFKTAAANSGLGPVEVARIDANGRVGIGTTSPGYRLDVRTSALGADGVAVGGPTGFIALHPSTVGGNYNPLVSANDQSIIFYGGSSTAGSGTGNLIIAPWSTSSVGMKIDYNGNVLIGRATSTVGQNVKLDVNGAINASAVLINGTPALPNTSGVSFNGNLNFPTGNVGIGTATPSSRLEVLGDVPNSLSNLGTGDAATITITNANVGGLNRIAKTLYEIGNLPIASIAGAYTVFNAGGNIGGDLIFSTQSHVGTGVQERMRIDANGNVGVGTTNPQHILDVKGVANVSSALLVNDMNVKPTIQAAFDKANSTTYTSNVVISVTDNTNAALRITQTGTGEAIRVEDSANPDATCFIVDANGSVGIGTQTPATQLQQFSATAVSRSIGTGTIYNLELVGSGVVNYGPTTNHPLNLVANNATVIRLDTSGNVGIGTTSPAYKLEVNGSFAAQTKSFVINHPTKPGMMLRHGSLEGPENGVYVRGRLDGKSIIELPDYWCNLVDESTITVNLTPIGRSQDIWVQSTSAYFIHLNQPADCFFTVFAERKDVDKLVVEY